MKLHVGYYGKVPYIVSWYKGWQAVMQGTPVGANPYSHPAHRRAWHAGHQAWPNRQQLQAKHAEIVSIYIKRGRGRPGGMRKRRAKVQAGNVQW